MGQQNMMLHFEEILPDFCNQAQTKRTAIALRDRYKKIRPNSSNAPDNQWIVNNSKPNKRKRKMVVQTTNVAYKKRRLNKRKWRDTDCLLRLHMWFKYAVKLPQYMDIFLQNGYNNLQSIEEEMTNEELIALGIAHPEHRSKIMLFVEELAIKSRQRDAAYYNS